MSNYSLAAKIFHRAALDPPAVGEMAFDLERSLYLKSSPNPKPGKHVFVCGLARAGTTILMREIHRSGQFASLAYSDMPLVMCPNLWRAMAGRPKVDRDQERAHGDGVLVNADSPEALEEVFWRIFCGRDYIRDDSLGVHRPDNEARQAYRDYVRLIMRRRGKTRYLSKTNNGVLRIGWLRESFPDAVILLPIREPLAHAQSLLSQHRRFATADPFTQRYMTWLVHHEFGATHRPFALASEAPRFTDPTDLNYWLEQWMRCYRYLDQTLDASGPGVYFIPYTELCNSPDVWAAIARAIDVEGAQAPEFVASQRPPERATDAELTMRARKVYQRIAPRALERLGVSTALTERP